MVRLQGWVTRLGRSHNPKVAGSNPAPATQKARINALGLSAMLRQIIATNRAGGWRKLKRDANSQTSERSPVGQTFGHARLGEPR